MNASKRYPATSAPVGSRGEHRRKQALAACLVGAGVGACLAGPNAAHAETMVVNSITYPVPITSSPNPYTPPVLRDGYSDNSLSLGNIGQQFTTGGVPLTVTALGYYDGPNNAGDNVVGYTPDGLLQAHQVGIWDSSGNLITSATVGMGITTPVNDFEYENLGNPVTLSANSTYTIAALLPAADETSLGDVFAQGLRSAVAGQITTLFGPDILNVNPAYGGGTTLTQPTTLTTVTPYLGPSFLYTAPVVVNNGLFAATGSSNGATHNQTFDPTIKDWGISAGTIGTITNNPDGTEGTTAYINGTGVGGSVGDIYQDVGALAPNTLYTLSVDVDKRATGGTGGAAGDLYLLNGIDDTGSQLASSAFTSSTTNDVWQTDTVTFMTGSSVSGDLTAEIEGLTDYLGIANVSITAVAVPEPASIGLLAIASLGLLKRRRRGS